MSSHRISLSTCLMTDRGVRLSATRACRAGAIVPASSTSLSTKASKSSSGTGGKGLSRAPCSCTARGYWPFMHPHSALCPDTSFRHRVVVDDPLCMHRCCGVRKDVLILTVLKAMGQSHEIVLDRLGLKGGTQFLRFSRAEMFSCT